jgi:ubiquinone/menaquinone biosynthesis C-methylase UbiE
VADSWEEIAGEWIARLDAGLDPARFGLLDDWMLRLLGDVGGLDVIDLGCGEGRFCRMLAARGARTLGVDLQPTFVERASALAGPGEEYLRGDIQSLDGVPDASFDLAVSYLSLLDVPDEVAALREAWRVLRAGGRLLVCNLAPLATAPAADDHWHRDVAGAKLHRIVDDYAHEGPRDVIVWAGQRVTNYHRMLSTTVNAFIQTGFRLTGLHEPLPTAAQLERFPQNADLHRAPIFVIYDLARER